MHIEANTPVADTVTVGATATPAPAKRARKPRTAKPAPVAATPAKPGRTVDADRAKRIAERTKLIGAERAAVAAIYSTPSLAISNGSKANGVYSELLANPKHRTVIAKLTARDGSGAVRCLANTKAGAFNPVAFNLDAGVFSRLASVGYIVASGDTFKLTNDGAAFARRAVKLAA